MFWTTLSVTFLVSVSSSSAGDWVVEAGSFVPDPFSLPDTPEIDPTSIFDYRGDFMSSMDHDTVSRLYEQRLTDDNHQQFRPTLESDNQTTPMGTIDLPKEPFFVTQSAVLYRVEHVRKFPTIMVKYQAHSPCKKFPVHPLLREFWFQSEAYRLGIAPEPIFVSPAVPLPELFTRNTRFSMDSNSRKKYVEKGASVRYLISKYVRGGSLDTFGYEFRKGVVPLALAASLCKQLVQVLWRLHSKNIVHGDIHPGNVMAERTALGKRRILLIDFGRAFIVNGNRSNRPFTYQGDWNHPFLSHWQIKGLPWDKRDDLFKAIYLMATLVHPRKVLWNYEKYLTPIRMFFWKMNGFWFSLKNRTLAAGTDFDPIDSLSEISSEDRQDIRESLIRILRLVRTLDDVNDELPYEAVIHELDKIHKKSLSALPPSLRDDDDMF